KSRSNRFDQKNESDIVADHRLIDSDAIVRVAQVSNRNMQNK
ncbi:9037_t:CDS:1, partial [Gigaspora rosea]